ncbi:MAG: hypothetical protein ACRESL_16975, partial [Pseudomonas sp.]
IKTKTIVSASHSLACRTYLIQPPQHFQERLLNVPFFNSATPEKLQHKKISSIEFRTFTTCCSPRLIQPCHIHSVEKHNDRDNEPDKNHGRKKHYS